MSPKSLFKRVISNGRYIVLFCCVLTALADIAAAKGNTAIIELFSYGKVNKIRKSYTVARQSGVFLKIVNYKKERCVFLDAPGVYPLSELEKQIDIRKKFLEFFRCNLSALLYRLKAPAQIAVTPAPRGMEGDKKNFFEKVWVKTVEDKIRSLPFNNVLAAAIWFGQQGNLARSAYILGQLHRVHKDKKWTLDLHHEAYAKTSMDEIDGEIAATRSRLLNMYSRRKNFALLIGVENYGGKPSWKDLKTPINDIRSLKRTLLDEFHFKKQNIFMLENPDYQAMVEGFLSLRDKVKSDSNLLIYYAGHGAKDDYGNYFWIPRDVGRYPINWVYTDYILGIIKKIEPLHLLLLVDSCFSGALNSHQSRSANNQGMETLYRKNSRQLITSGGDEPVIDKYSSRHSVFAEVFLDILKNQPRDKILIAEQLFSRLQPRVSSLSNQTPTYDRLPGSGDQWGQFCFIKQPEIFFAAGKTVSEDFPAIVTRPGKSVSSARFSPDGEDKHAETERGEDGGYLGIGVNTSFDFTPNDSVAFNGYNIFYNYKITSLSSLNIRLWTDWAKYKSDRSEIETNRLFISSAWQRRWSGATGFFRGMYYGLGLGINFLNNMKYKYDNGDVSLNRAGVFILPEIGWKTEKNYFISLSLSQALFPYYYKEDDIDAEHSDTLDTYWKESGKIKLFCLQGGFVF